MARGMDQPVPVEHDPDRRPDPDPDRRRTLLPRVWEGVVRIPLTGPLEIHHANGDVTILAPEEQYVPGDY
jgi:hypothetical protein